MDAIQFLLEEHQKVKNKFTEMESAGTQQRAQMFHQLVPELKIHEEIEDTYLYAPISKDPAAQGTKAAGFLEHQDEDVEKLEQKIKKLMQTEPADDDWLDRLHDVRDTLMDHVREEEQEILPQISQIWDRSKLDMAGQQMAAAKQEAMKNPQHYATAFSQQATESARETPSRTGRDDRDQRRGRWTTQRSGDWPPAPSW
jgi:hemerythrin-like domain-containing protein